MKGALLSFLLLLCLVGCGYRFSALSDEMPGGVSSLTVPLFANKTTEPLLEMKLTNALREQLARSKSCRLVSDSQTAEAALEGAVAGYHSKASAYDQNDDIARYRATMQVSVQLQRPAADKPLWQRTLSWHVDYAAAADKQQERDNEQQAIEELAQRLAEEVYAQLTSGF